MSDELPADTPALMPVREQAVDFYGDQLVAAQTADAVIWVPLRPVCEQLGLNWASQYQRLQRDVVLQAEARSVVITTTDRGERAMIALPLEMLPGWLFGISAERVKPELREKIVRYRRECFRVLWAAFKGDILAAPELPAGNLTAAEQTLELITAMQHLAQQQVELERRYTTMADWMRPFVQGTRQQITAHEARLSALEMQLAAGATISELQAAELAGAVKLVAAALEAAGTPNGYGRVYNELYHRYGISSYKMLPLGQFAAAMTWLRGWYDEVGSTES